MKQGTKRHLLGLSLAAGAAAGVYYLMRTAAPAEPQPVATPEALLTASMQAALASRLQEIMPEGAVALVLHDDNGDLAHTLAAHSRMLFSADGSGAASVTRPAWPKNVIRADCDPKKLWLAENSLDMAVFVNVLQRQNDPSALLRELQRVLKPGGQLALPPTVRTGQFSEAVWRSTMELLGLPAQYAWTQEEVRRLLEETGWEILSDALLSGNFPMALFVCRRRTV